MITTAPNRPKPRPIISVLTEINDDTKKTAPPLQVFYDADDSFTVEVIARAVRECDAGPIGLHPLQSITARRALGTIAEDPISPVYLLEPDGRIIAGLANVRHRLLPTGGDGLIGRIRAAYRPAPRPDLDQPNHSLTRSPFIRWGE